jgi:hypothetical protein
MLPNSVRQIAGDNTMESEEDFERCDICRQLLDRKGDNWQMLCPLCADAVSHFLDATGLNDEHMGHVVRLVTTIAKRSALENFAVQLPTYYGHAYPDAVADGLLPEFGKPFVPAAVHCADGLRVVLGSSDPRSNSPDIQIERRPNGWAMFLHPESGGDSSGFVYFLDDGRSFVLPERGVTASIEIGEWEEITPILDRKKRI